MNKGIVITIIVIVIFYTGTQFLGNYKAKSDLGDQMEKQLDFVDQASLKSTAQDLAKKAKDLGITIAPDDIQVRYEDTDIQSYAQRVVGGKLGVQYTNKRVTIVAQYTAHVDLIPIKEEVVREKIRQVAAPQLPINKTAQELLDAN